MANSENRMKQLKSMLNDGLISKEEFDNLKKRCEITIIPHLVQTTTKFKT